MGQIQLLHVPDELLNGIVNQFTTAADTDAFGLVCRRVWQLATTSPVWRRHCLLKWTMWDERHGVDSKVDQPPLQTDWRALYVARAQTDRHARDLFEKLLSTQQARASRMHEVAAMGADVMDLLLHMSRETPDDAPDVLARRWHATAIERLIQRRHAVDVWDRLRRGEDIALEEALGAYDQFVLRRSNILTREIRLSLDLIASEIRVATPDIVNLTIRQRAVCIAEYLRSKRHVGMEDIEDYHALRNSFISLSLSNNSKGCLPLQSVAIYSAVARRLGIDARPTNSPSHVYAVISPPDDMTLDGQPRLDVDPESAQVSMYMDPFRKSEEVPLETLRGQLSQLGIPTLHHAEFLAPASTEGMVLRAGRNILASIEQFHTPGVQDDQEPEDHPHWPFPEPDDAKYAALWSLFVLGDSDPAVASVRRRQSTRFLLERLYPEYPQDVETFAEIGPRLLANAPSHALVLEYIETLQTADHEGILPKRRAVGEEVAHHIGTYFEHRRYGYKGFIVGWDPRCSAKPSWISQMRVDDLPRGRNQPFYNVV